MVLFLATIILIIVVLQVATTWAGLNYKEKAELYYARWKEANALLEGADLDAVADGKPLIERGKAKESKVSPWGALEKNAHTALTQKRLNQMDGYSRFKLERARLSSGLEPVDSLEGMNDYYTVRMIELRTDYGYE